MRIHPKRSLALVIALVALFPAAVGVLAACGGSKSSSTPTAATGAADTVAASTPTTTASSQGPFVSELYDYSVASSDWTGTSAQEAWDGTGSPGDGDPTVDILVGPEGQRAFAYAGPTKLTLEKFVAKARRTNAEQRACPAKPEKTAMTKIGGERAILDELHCGVFAISADALHNGEVYVFFTYEQPGNEPAMREWFRSLVKAVSFSA
jgi:hypothetical protein